MLLHDPHTDEPLRHYSDEEKYPLWFLAFIIVVFAGIIIWDWLCDYWWSLLGVAVVGSFVLHSIPLALVAAVVETLLLTAATEYAYSQGYRFFWRADGLQDPRDDYYPF